MRTSRPPFLNAPCGTTLVCLFGLLLLLPAGDACGAAKAALEAEKAKIEQGIKQYEINIGRLEQGIGKQQDDIEKNQGQGARTSCRASGIRTPGSSTIRKSLRPLKKGSPYSVIS